MLCSSIYYIVKHTGFQHEPRGARLFWNQGDEMSTQMYGMKPSRGRQHDLCFWVSPTCTHTPQKFRFPKQQTQQETVATARLHLITLPSTKPSSPAKHAKALSQLW